MSINDFECNACLKKGPASLYREVTGVDKKRYNLYKCSNCGMVMVFPLPTAQFLEDYYSDNFTGGTKEGFISWNPIESNKAVIEDGYIKLRYVEKYSGFEMEKGKLLDIGCGYGFFVYAAKTSGYDAMGLDLDKEAVSFGRSELGLHIVRENVDSFSNISPGEYDVVTMWSTLEHLLSPSKILKQINMLLKCRGVFAANVPNIEGPGFKIWGQKWHLMIPPLHLNYFNKASLKNMLIQNGFEVLFIGTIPLFASPYFSFGIRKRIMEIAKGTGNKLFEKMAQFSHRILTLAKRYLVYMPVNRIITMFNLNGDNIFFVARKK